MMDVISQPLSDQSLMDATMMSSNADHFASTLSTSDEMAAMPLKGVRIGLVCDTIGAKKIYFNSPWVVVNII